MARGKLEDRIRNREAMLAAKRASREHPSRVLGVILGDARGSAVVNAQVGSGDGWGNLPPHEREAALQQIGREYPPHYREAIEQYFKRLATGEDRGP